MIRKESDEPKGSAYEMKYGIIKAIPIGFEELTDEEKRKADEDFTRVLRKYNVIGADEVVDGDKIIKVGLI